ncbi:uroporphyrinogen-III synthase [Actinomyces sp. MRS3W]|uniref:uroporphyrinogen-III synthase n=1 Tax=Actinomyces sp. MRS3W TaxID=2800796 RepID=UPI0028FD5C66|nr:uroporphyrinogen-III synthase [Actinomyces sp. MRS3W]MDU0349678.1 uroporphyrinogen-III synthase [Actinomyces sp. MRS3W]
MSAIGPEQPCPAHTADARPAPPASGTALAGRRVLLPRAKPDDAIAAALAAAGAEVVCVGVTRAVPGPAGPRERAAAALAAGEYAWVVVTSARTVEFSNVGALRAPLPRRTRIAVVGQATARAIRERLGREPDLVAAGSGAALLESPPLRRGPDASGRRLLLPGSALASPALAEGLSGAGWQVDAVAAYTMEPVPATELPESLASDWARGDFDAVVLVAGSSTRALMALVGPPPPATRVVAIGRPTAKAATAAGLQVDAIAAQPTPAAIRDSVLGILTLGILAPAAPSHPTAPLHRNRHK